MSEKFFFLVFIFARYFEFCKYDLHLTGVHYCGKQFRCKRWYETKYIKKNIVDDDLFETLVEWAIKFFKNYKNIFL